MQTLLQSNKTNCVCRLLDYVELALPLGKGQLRKKLSAGSPHLHQLLGPRGPGVNTVRQVDLGERLPIGQSPLPESLERLPVARLPMKVVVVEMRQLLKHAQG